MFAALGDVEIGLQSVGPAEGRLWTIQSSGVTKGPFDGTFQIIDRTLGKSRLIIDAKGTVSVDVLQIMGGADYRGTFSDDVSAFAGGIRRNNR